MSWQRSTFVVAVPLLLAGLAAACSRRRRRRSRSRRRPKSPRGRPRGRRHRAGRAGGARGRGRRASPTRPMSTATRCWWARCSGGRCPTWPRPPASARRPTASGMRGAWRRPASRHPLVDDADTLASVAWLDLGREAMLVAWPDDGPALVQLHAAQPVDAGAGHAGAMPRAAACWWPAPNGRAACPRACAWCAHPPATWRCWVRIQTSGSDADLRAVQALQARLRLVPQTQRTPFGRRRGRCRPTRCRPGDVARQVVQAHGRGRLLQAAGPAAGRGGAARRGDAPLLQRMARIGLEPGKPPAWTRWSRRCRRR